MLAFSCVDLLNFQYNIIKIRATFCETYSFGINDPFVDNIVGIIVTINNLFYSSIFYVPIGKSIFQLIKFNRVMISLF